ncbi:hypothetical protein Taro_005283 [Colocasia esculenta]|uniref:Uncharacterized protein n=1 Tax=Colocasia esculenta TaxID=4460 RepID=A0A843TPF6_COLES|nr:hypothetical protein [Colocasia esculenta]
MPVRVAGEEEGRAWCPGFVEHAWSKEEVFFPTRRALRGSGFSQSGALVVLVEVLPGPACVASAVLLAAVFSLMVCVLWSWGLCILVKVLPRIALCCFWRRFFPGVLCVHFGPLLSCPCDSNFPHAPLPVCACLYGSGRPAMEHPVVCLLTDVAAAVHVTTSVEASPRSGATLSRRSWRSR